MLPKIPYEFEQTGLSSLSALALQVFSAACCSSLLSLVCAVTTSNTSVGRNTCIWAEANATRPWLTIGGSRKLCNTWATKAKWKHTKPLQKLDGSIGTCSEAQASYCSIFCTVGFHCGFSIYRNRFWTSFYVIWRKNGLASLKLQPQDQQPQKRYSELMGESNSQNNSEFPKQKEHGLFFNTKKAFPPPIHISACQ